MRLFFLNAYELNVGNGSRVIYQPERFYQVDDQVQAAAFVQAGVAETEDQHEQRLTAEAAKAAEPAAEDPGAAVVEQPATEV